MHVLKFSAAWCAPCKQMSQNLSQDIFSHLTVEEIDIDKNPTMVKEYAIRSIPTLVLLDEQGEEQDRISGGASVQQLTKFFAQ